jgi:hypothetical protein
MLLLVLQDPLPLNNIGMSLLRTDASEQDVHVLERAALRLGDETREDEHAREIDGAEHEEELVAQRSLQTWGDPGDDEVEEPLGGGGGGETIVTGAVGEDVCRMFALVMMQNAT